jgi:ketosteroid isomerase-like protein
VNPEQFYRAFLAADEEALSELVDASASWSIRGDSLLAGDHRGAHGIAALRRRIDELTGGTWRPLREDSFDVATSAHHAVVMDRFLAERGQRRLDSHEAVVLAPLDAAKIGRLFHYLHDPAAHAAFWS